MGELDALGVLYGMLVARPLNEFEIITKYFAATKRDTAQGIREEVKTALKKLRDLGVIVVKEDTHYSHNYMTGGRTTYKMYSLRQGALEKLRMYFQSQGRQLPVVGGLEKKLGAPSSA